MMLTYIQILSLGWPTVQAHAVGNGSTYESLVWEAGDPLPSKQDMDNWVAANPTQALDSAPPTTFTPMFGSNISNSNNMFLGNAAGIASNLVGFILPRNARLIGATLAINGTINSDITFSIRVNGSPIDYTSFTLPAYTSKRVLTPDDGLPNLLKGDEVSIRVSCQRSVPRPMCTLEFSGS